MVLAGKALVKRRHMSNEQIKIEKSKPAVLTMLAKMKEFGIQSPE